MEYGEPAISQSDLNCSGEMVAQADTSEWHYVSATKQRLSAGDTNTEALLGDLVTICENKPILTRIQLEVHPYAARRFRPTPRYALQPIAG